MKLAKRTVCMLLCLCIIMPILALGTNAEESLCEVCQEASCTCPAVCTGGEACLDGHTAPCPLAPPETAFPQTRSGEELTFMLYNPIHDEPIDYTEFDSFIDEGALVTIKVSDGSFVAPSQLVVDPAAGIAVTEFVPVANTILISFETAGTYKLFYKANPDSTPVDTGIVIHAIEKSNTADFILCTPSGDPLYYTIVDAYMDSEALVSIKTLDGSFVSASQIVTDPAENVTVTDSEFFDNTMSFAISAPGSYRLLYRADPQSEPVDTGISIRVNEGSPGQQIPAGCLVAFGGDLGNGLLSVANLMPGNPCQTQFGIVDQNGNVSPMNPDLLWSTSDLVKIEKVNDTFCKVTVMSNGNGYIRAEGAQYPFHVWGYGAEDDRFLDSQENLLVSTDDGSLAASLTLTVNEESTVSLRYGSTGASVPVTALLGGISPEGVVSLTANDDGTFTLKGLKTGSTVISHGNAAGSNGLRINVVEAKAENKHLFIKGGYSGSDTYLSIEPNSSIYTNFYFGTFSDSDCEEVEVKASGNVTVQKSDNGYLVTAGAAGNGLIWYEKAGIAYTMPVMVGSNNYGSNSQPGNTAVINGITYTTARLDGETLQVMPNFGQDYTADSTTDFAQSIVLAAMNGGSLASGAFSYISDFSASFVYCVSDLDETTPSTNGRLSLFSTKVPSTNITTNGVLAQAEATKGFKSIIALSFTVTDPREAMPRRITLQCPMSYNIRGGDVTITIDSSSELDTAAELNVILSSDKAFLNWLDNHDEGVTVSGKFALGGEIRLNLPAFDYSDGIVVAQMVSDINENGRPVSTIQLVGHGTKMAGLVSKGGLVWVSDISFVANNSITMTHGSETFTCGILGAYDYSDASAPFDVEYAARYCTDGAPATMADALAASSAKLATYPADLKWMSATTHYLANCTFEGYDYGVRSTSTGVVGGGMGCSFSYCHYGIYMDSNGFGVSAGNPHNVDYSTFRFLNNKYAVRLVSLPQGATPYVFRIHDSDFDHNHFDFHITPEGDYYFYRNYFGGYWREHDHHGRWKNFFGKHRFDLDEEEQHHKTNKNEGHRAYRAIEEKGVSIFATLSRDREHNGYRIYHNRKNRYLMGDESMPVSSASIGELTERTELEIASENNGEITVTASFIMGGDSNS